MRGESALDHSGWYRSEPPHVGSYNPDGWTPRIRLVLVAGAFCILTLSGYAKENRSSHWAYQPLTKHESPQVKQSGWPRTNLDKFILAKIEANGFSPAPDVDKSTLIRRLFYDLIGLPPTPEQINAFVRDGSPEAYVKLVDELLASHHF